MLSWACNEAVCTKVGVNAAIVFQHLWFWAHNWQPSAHSVKAGRVWRAYSAVSLSRDFEFMSDDVILDALHRLEDAGLILKRRGKGAVLWAIADAGYTLMGETPSVWQRGAPAAPPQRKVRQLHRLARSARPCQRMRRWRGLCVGGLAKTPAHSAAAVHLKGR